MNVEHGPFDMTIPTKLGEAAGSSMTRPCECGLGLRPRRLFGFSMEPVSGALLFLGLTDPGARGLPSTDRLADCFVAGNVKIQQVCIHPAMRARRSGDQAASSWSIRRLAAARQSPSRGHPGP